LKKISIIEVFENSTGVCPGLTELLFTKSILFWAVDTGLDLYGGKCAMEVDDIYVYNQTKYE
jgi:hypothetical protein